MASFNYRGLDGGGNPVSGTLEAADRRQALARLRRQGVRPLEVLAAGGAQAAPKGAAAHAAGGATAPSATGGLFNRQGRAAAAVDSRRSGSVQSRDTARQTVQKNAHKPSQTATAQSAMLAGSAGDEGSALTAAIFAANASKGSGRLLARFRSKRSLALPFLLKFRQLHSSGMPLGEALQVMANRMSDPQLKDLSQHLYKDLSEGRTLAASMRSRGDIFEPTMSYLIEAGEATGNLVPILTNIIEHLQTQKALSKKIKSALAYPCFITVVAMVVVGIFLFFLMPRIEDMLASMGGEMSFAAAFMIGLSEFVLQQGPFILGGLLLFTLIIFRWRKTPRGRRQTDIWLLRLPLVRNLAYNTEICRATNVLAILLGNGVNTTESLRLAENTLQNTILRERFVLARNNINDGSSFAAAFKRYHLLSDMDIDILNVGESTGSLVSSFAEVYNTHAEELTSSLSRLTTLISGGAMAFAFTLIFILALSIVMSVMNVSQSMLS